MTERTTEQHSKEKARQAKEVRQPGARWRRRSTRRAKKAAGAAERNTAPASSGETGPNRRWKLES
ncbi:hypothetical protein [Rhizobium mongolense]|uniref:Uncharacterized protein n=1 Tax=Rhizobium mongolense TaxID=57676 RepID=A0A7W6RR56_9HYPH|nr:hypothetical protein [Rhizobium mongolense]MBB4277049.1 hypothetical protein [Rhizobium mongolense]